MVTKTKLSILALIMAVFTLAAISRASTIGKIQLHTDPLVYGHLVISGEVVAIDYTEASLAEWGIEPKEAVQDIKRDVAVLRIAVNRVLKGTSGLKEIEIAAFKSRIGSLELGQSAVLGTHYNRAYGKYILRGPEGLYVQDNRDWICQADQSAISFDEIVARVESARLEHVAGDAEVIVLAEVLSKEVVARELKAGRGIFEDYRMKVRSVYKGDVNESVITISVLKTGDFVPEWRVPAPVKMAVGDVWYVFLQAREFGYYPFAGCNGLLKVDGENIIYDHRIPYYWSKAAVEDYLRAGPPN
jgi:hypothetical protein